MTKPRRRSSTSHKDRDQKELSRAIYEAKFLDDLFGRVVLRNCTDLQKCALAQAIIRPILEWPDLEITYAQSQRDMKELYSHSAVMDLFAKDKFDQLFDLEFQLAPFTFARLVAYSAELTKETLPPGFDYSQMKDSWIIFLTNQTHWADTGKEIFQDGPVAHFEWSQLVHNKYIRMENGYSHICVVDLSYNGNDELGDILRDLRNPNPYQIKNPILRTVEKMLKQSKKGHEIMSTSFQKLIDRKEAEAVRRARRKARNQVAKEITKEVTERVEKEIAERVEKEIAERVRRETADRVRKETAERVRKETAERVRKETAERVRKETAERVRKETAERVREETSSRIKNESIRNYFRKGGEDPYFIADVLQTSVKHVMSIQKKMQKRPV